MNFANKNKTETHTNSWHCFADLLSSSAQKHFSSHLSRFFICVFLEHTFRVFFTKECDRRIMMPHRSIRLTLSFIYTSIESWRVNTHAHTTVDWLWWMRSAQRSAQLHCKVALRQGSCTLVLVCVSVNLSRSSFLNSTHIQTVHCWFLFLSLFGCLALSLSLSLYRPAIFSVCTWQSCTRWQLLLSPAGCALTGDAIHQSIGISKHFWLSTGRAKRETEKRKDQMSHTESFAL